MDRESLYQKALIMIEGVHLSIDGVEQPDNQVSIWLRELAKEALAGVDPTTGHKVEFEKRV